MNRWTMPLVTILVGIVLVLGCSKGGDNPVTPTDLTATRTSAPSTTQTHLWGYYDVFIDIPTHTVEATLNRQAMFTANVVSFLNGKPAGLSLIIKDTPVGSDYVDVDIYITIAHPFSNMPQYNGYDVRGIFMGDGSKSMAYNPDLIYPVLGTDQFMLPDPDDEFGGPDGYTRWFNRAEFGAGDSPLFQYTPGKLASPGFTGTSTLNPYKYFADGLAATQDLWTWLDAHADQHGRFSSGASNTRNYYLRFPNAKGIKFGYAVIANWGGAEPQFHPSNAPEAVALHVADNSTVYYAGSSDKGGDLRLDISVWDWDAKISGELMEDYKVFIESTVLTAPYEFNTADMTPTSGTGDYSTYLVEIPADNIKGTAGNELWVIVEQKGFDYTNDFGVNNLAGSDPLAAFFRYDLTVWNQKPNTPPVITEITDDIPPDGLNTVVNYLNTAVTYTALFDDPDPGQSHTFKWFIEDSSATGPSDPPDPMPYCWVPQTVGGHKIWVKVSDGFDEVTGGPYAITKTNTPPVIDGITDNIPPDGLNTYVTKSNTAVTYTALHNDPDQGQAHTIRWYIETSSATGPSDPPDPMPYNWAPKDVGGYKIWVKVSDGFDEVTGGPYLVTRAMIPNWQWTRTWGGSGLEYNFGVTADGAGNIYVAGSFETTVDFNPGAGTDNHTSNGQWDCFLSKFSASGVFLWAKTWGGSYTDESRDVAVDGSGNVYVTGYFYWTVDFDPGPGVDNHTVGGDFLSKFDPSGNFLWAKTWNALSYESYPHRDVTLDGSGNVYVTGSFYGTVDFDPGPGVDNHMCGGVDDSYLSKFDSSGAFLWARTWGGTDFDAPRGVAVDGSGSVYVTGYFASTADFDPDPFAQDWHTPNGGYDIFLSTFDPSGTFLWARTWGSGAGGINDLDYGYGVAADGSGNVYVTGEFMGTADFDPGPGTDEHTTHDIWFDAFLSKFDSSGTFLWAKTWGGYYDDLGESVALDASGRPCITGRFDIGGDFDPGPCSDFHYSKSASTDGFVSRFDSSGTFLGATTWGGTETDSGDDVDVDSSGNIYVVGHFVGTVDFDPGSGYDNHTAIGYFDDFLSKFAPE